MGQTTSSTTHALIAPLSHPWLQYIGGISYSLYLAHWPVIVVYPFATGRAVDGALADGVAVLAASWALAHACKWGWEDRFRFVGSDTIGGDLGINGRSFTVITAKAGAPSVGSVKPSSNPVLVTFRCTLLMTITVLGAALWGGCPTRGSCVKARRVVHGCG